MTITRGLAWGAGVSMRGRGAAGEVQAPKVFSARAKPASGLMSPVITSTALSGRYQV